MEEVPHHVNLRKNVLWLGKGKKKGRFTHRIKGLEKEEGRREWSLREEKKKEDPHTLFAAASVPKSRLTMAAEAKPGLDKGKEQEEEKREEEKDRSIEVVDFMAVEINDEAAYKRDCARAWRQIFGKSKKGDPSDTSELQATDVERIRAFEKKIHSMYPDLFVEPTGLPPARKDGGFRIRTIPGAEAPHRSPYRMTPDEWEIYKEKMNTLLSKRLIRKSSSPYAAPVIFIPQGVDSKGKPKIHMCIDYRALNKITIKDRFPLLHPEDLIAKLHGMRRFSKLDFFAGFHQHRNHSESIEKTAFMGPDGLYEWLVMPFGAGNATSEAIRLTSDLLSEHINNGYCICIIDDILIFSKNDEDHERHTKAVLDTIRKAGFRLQEEKCSFGRKTAPFLGFEIGSDSDSTGNGNKDDLALRMTHEKI